MKKLILLLALIAILLAGLIFSRQPAAAQSGVPTPAAPAQEGTSPGGIRVNAPNASISPNSLTYKVLSNPYCFQPDPALNRCIINVRYYQATDNGTSAPYMLGANLSINGKLRARINLFFENNLYFTYDMAPAGLEVPCGAPNAGGLGAAYGNVYLVKVEPIDSTGAGMGYDQASLACPAYAP